MFKTTSVNDVIVVCEYFIFIIRVPNQGKMSHNIYIYNMQLITAMSSDIKSKIVKYIITVGKIIVYYRVT